MFHFRQQTKIKKEIECLPSIRKYQTLSSIPNDSKVYRFYSELEEQMFSLFSNQKTTTEQEELIKTILFKFESIKEQKHFSQYFVDLLVYYFLIRPKQTEITCNLLSILLSNNENQRLFIIETIQNNHLYQNHSFLQNILDSQGIHKIKPKAYEKQKNTIFSIYEKGSLEFILKENDVNSLKEYIQQNNINKDQKIQIDKNSPFSLIFDLEVFQKVLNL